MDKSTTVDVFVDTVPGTTLTCQIVLLNGRAYSFDDWAGTTDELIRDVVEDPDGWSWTDDVPATARHLGTYEVVEAVSVVKVAVRN